MRVQRLWTGRSAESVDDYSGVLVELEEAHLHSHTYRIDRDKFENSLDDGASDDGGDGNDQGKTGDDEGTGMLEMSVAEYSIEGLRKEVRRGGKGDKWTAYESERPFPFPSLTLLDFLFAFLLGDAQKYRFLCFGDVDIKAFCSPTVKSKLINKAIQDIGMGTYNWHLFILCGFGWFADK
jgi:hypothetical protein